MIPHERRKRIQTYLSQVYEPKYLSIGILVTLNYSATDVCLLHIKIKDNYRYMNSYTVSENNRYTGARIWLSYGLDK